MKNNDLDSVKTGKKGCLVIFSICLFIGCIASMGGVGILVFLILFAIVAFGLEYAYEQIELRERRKNMKWTAEMEEQYRNRR
jgi:hypothetical protein